VEHLEHLFSQGWHGTPETRKRCASRICRSRRDRVSESARVDATGPTGMWAVSSARRVRRGVRG
jgi:hypothetical protein